MSARATSSRRRAAGRTRSRSKQRRRRRPSPRKQGGRRWLVIGGTLVAFLIAGYALFNTEKVQDAIREVTLPLKHEDIIRQQAADKGLPPDLVAAVIFRESRFEDQTSSAGARGLMQITPRTAEIIEDLSGGSTFEQEDLADPDINIRYGTFYLRHLLDKFGENEVAALAAYNAGETNVAAWGGSELELDQIEFPETRDYVEDVLDKRDDYRRHYRDELGL
jgi:soluble lytic murein transglycosylase